MDCLSRVLTRIRQRKRKPTPAGKNDQVISVEPKVQIECGAPRLIKTTIAHPVNRERKESPVASCVVGSVVMNVEVVRVASRVQQDLNRIVGPAVTAPDMRLLDKFSRGNYPGRFKCDPGRRPLFI